ncbi:hypothetical protein HDV00_010923, partial [Rhizophlyctis rosea]
MNEDTIVKLEKTKRNIQQLKLEKLFLIQKLDEILEKPQPITEDITIQVSLQLSFPVANTQNQISQPAQLPPPHQASSEPDDIPPPPIPDLPERIKPPKSKKRKTDPNAPKKPTNAFFVFCQQHRPELRDKMGTEKFNLSEATQILAKRWKEMSDEQRKVYQGEENQQNLTAAPISSPSNGSSDMFRDQKTQYAKDMYLYNSAGPAQPPPVTPSSPLRPVTADSSDIGATVEEYSEDEDET